MGALRIAAGAVDAHHRGYNLGVFDDQFDLDEYLATLPSDDELIQKLRSSRSEFERLLTLYREKGERAIVSENPSARTLLSRMGARHAIRYYQVDAPGNIGNKARREVHPLRFHVAQKLYREWGTPWRWDYKTKSIVFFPITPEVVGGYLKWSPEDPTLRIKYRAVENLDREPPNWKYGECVFRAVEPHWFLELCRNKMGG